MGARFVDHKRHQRGNPYTLQTKISPWFYSLVLNRHNGSGRSGGSHLKIFNFLQPLNLERFFHILIWKFMGLLLLDSRVQAESLLWKWFNQFSCQLVSRAVISFSQKRLIIFQKFNMKLGVLKGQKLTEPSIPEKFSCWGKNPKILTK